MRIVWRERARADVQKLVEYISRDSQTGAFRVHSAITDSVELLAAWPDLGRVRRKNVRVLVLPRTPYIVIYRRRGKTI